MINKLHAGRNITHYRQARGWTQMELALRLNVSQSTIAQWENGLELPDVYALLTLAQLFDVSMEHLLTAELHPEPAVPDGQKFKESTGSSSMNWDDLLLNLSSASHEALCDLATHCAQICDLYHLAHLAMYLRSSDFDQLLLAAMSRYNWDEISSLACHASPDALHQLADHCEKTGNLTHIHKFAFYLSLEDRDRLFRMAVEASDWKAIDHLAIHASQKTLQDMVLYCLKNDAMNNIHRITPYITQDNLDRLFLSAVNANDWKAIIKLSHYASHQALHELITQYELIDDMQHLPTIASVVCQDDRDLLFHRAIAANNRNAISILTGFASPEARHALVVCCEQSEDVDALSRTDTFDPFNDDDDFEVHDAFDDDESFDRAALIMDFNRLLSDEITRHRVRRAVETGHWDSIPDLVPDLSHLLLNSFVLKCMRPKKSSSVSPALQEYARATVDHLNRICDEPVNVLERFESLRQALESQNYDALSEFVGLLDGYIGPDWLKEYAELCIKHE